MGLSLLTQVLALAFFIVMAHYAPPSTFGEYAAASVLLGLSGLFTEAGMHAAVIQRSEEELQEAASTAFLANLVGGVGLALLAVAAAPIVGLFFHSRTVGFASAALAATIPFSAASIVPGAMIRRRVSTRLAFVQPVSVIGYGVAGVALLAAGYGLWGLVLATYVATLLSTTSIWMFSRWRPTFRLASMEMWRSLAAYGRPVMISLFLREVGFAGMTAFVGRAFTSTVLGQFRYALRLVTQATSSVTLSAAYVLLPAFTRIYKDERRFAAAVLRALRILTLLVFPITLAFIPLGRPIATTILGKEWSGAGPIMMAMAGFGVALSFSSVSAEAFKACGRTDVLPRLHALTAAAPIAFMFAFLPAGAVGMGLAVSAGFLLESLYGVHALSGILKIRLSSIFRPTLAPLVASAVMVTVLLALDHYLLHAARAERGKGLVLLTLEIGVGILTYLVTLLLVSRNSVAELRATLGHMTGRPAVSASIK